MVANLRAKEVLESQKALRAKETLVNLKPNHPRLRPNQKKTKAQ
jgi:hypothetical protein